MSVVGWNQSTFFPVANMWCLCYEFGDPPCFSAPPAQHTQHTSTKTRSSKTYVLAIYERHVAANLAMGAVLRSQPIAGEFYLSTVGPKQ